MTKYYLVRRTKGQGDNGGETCERNDVHGIVVKNRDQPECLPLPQVLKVAIRNQLAGQIALAFYSQDLVFQLHQAAALETQLPKPARAEQQIQMLHARERRPAARHAITCFEQRLIVRFAVVRDEHVEARQVVRQRRQ